PGAAHRRALRRLLLRAVQPAVPFGRHAAGFRLAIGGVQHPAPLGPAQEPAAAAVITVAELIRPHQLAVEPCVEACSETHRVSRFPWATMRASRSAANPDPAALWHSPPGSVQSAETRLFAGL